MTALNWKATTVAVAAFGPIDEPNPIGIAGSQLDYGSPQTVWSNISTVDRTLSMGIRVRLIGLPVSTFLPSGTLYFLQLQNDEIVEFNTAVIANGETPAIQAVTAGKGFSVTTNELSRSSGVGVPYLPQGPMSFVYSDTNSVPAALAGKTGGPASTVLSANGQVIILGFGLQPGSEFRFDYAHHIEYIPRYAAAGLIATKVEAPNGAAREAISRGTQIAQQSIAGSTTLAEVAPFTSGLSEIGVRLGRAAVGMIPGGGMLAGIGAGLSKAMGGPAWLTSALGSLSS